MRKDDRNTEKTRYADEIDEAARRRRQRRQKDRRLKQIAVLLFVLALLGVSAAVYAFVLVPRVENLPWPSFLGNRPAMITDRQSGQKDEGVTVLEQSREQAVEGEEKAAPAQSSQQPQTQEQPETQPPAQPQTQGSEPQTEAAEPAQTSEAQAMVAQAQTLAMGYDYDGAIAQLMTISGYDQDPQIQQMITDYTAQRDACVAVDPYSVPHIFYHSLLNSTAKAFDVAALGQGAVDGYNAWMVTVDEFDAITQRLYDSGYVYVRLRDLVTETTDADGSVHFAPNPDLKLPEGKKAIVLSVDDCSYYHSYEAASFPEKLVLDDQGSVKCLYTDPAGNTSVGDYDVVPRLNSFLEAHPDGAYHGARGILAMTGYNGVFGYRTDIDYLLKENLMEDQQAWLDQHPDFNYDQDVEEATKIAEALKAEGWEFASHTWGHLSVTDKSVETLKTDNEKWVATVEPIVGKVDTIIFAHGNDIGSWEGYEGNEQYDYYNSAGYHYYCNVDGSVPHWVQITDRYVRQGRIDVDGYRLWLAQNGEDSSLSQLIDLSGIFNQDRPTPVVANGQG